MIKYATLLLALFTNVLCTAQAIEQPAQQQKTIAQKICRYSAQGVFYTGSGIFVGSGIVALYAIGQLVRDRYNALLITQGFGPSIKDRTSCFMRACGCDGVFGVAVSATLIALPFTANWLIKKYKRAQNTLSLKK